MHSVYVINDVIINAYGNAPTLLLNTKVVLVCVSVQHLYANFYLIVLNYTATISTDVIINTRRWGESILL